MDSYIRNLFSTSVSEEYLLNFRKLISFLVRVNSEDITLDHDGMVPLAKNLVICIYGEVSSGKSSFLDFIIKHFPNRIEYNLFKMSTKPYINNILPLEDKYMTDSLGILFNDNLFHFLMYNPEELPLKKVIYVINENSLDKIKNFKGDVIPIYFPNTFEYDENFHEKTDKIDPNEVQNYFDVPVKIEELKELQNFFLSQ